MFYERKIQDGVCAADIEVSLVVYVDSFTVQHKDCDVCQLSKICYYETILCMGKMVTRHILLPVLRR